MQVIIVGVLLGFSACIALADVVESCLLEAINNAAPNEVVASLRQRCGVAAADKPTESAPAVLTELSFDTTLQNEDKRFYISGYQRNYLLPITYRTNPNSRRNDNLYDGLDFDQAEVKFQLSMQAPVVKGVLGGDLWVTYTQQSWWQLYNQDYSAPFRETNYEPEVLLRKDLSANILGLNLHRFDFGYNHQSNGRGGDLSRSWNRLFTSLAVNRGNLALIGRVWWRIPESKADDDNPDISHYLGYGDIKIGYKWRQQVISATLRNNLRSDNKGTLQLDWTVPVGDRFKVYLQYFTGYGESLIDYDQSVNRIGLGVVLTDWL